MGKEKTDLKQLLSREEQCSALLRTKLHYVTNSNAHLTGEIQQGKSEHKATKQIVQVANVTQMKQNTVTTLESQNNAMSPVSKELREKVCKLDHQKIFLEDPQACMWTTSTIQWMTPLW